MSNQKKLKRAITVIQLWEKELNNYTFGQLLKQPTINSWSLGQVYIHLINSTLQFHLKEVEFCLNTDENKEKSKNFRGFLVYKILGKFPPIKIKVPASELYTPKQPKSKEQIVEGLRNVKVAMENTLTLLQNSSKKGKTEHPGFNFLSAREWYQLIPMHFEHHLRQKSRIDKFLTNE